jgi:hypothetical protein
LRLTYQVDKFTKLKEKSEGQGLNNIEAKLALGKAYIFGSNGAPVDHEAAKKLLREAGSHTKHAQLWARVYLGALKGDEEMINQARNRFKLSGLEVDEICRKVKQACSQSNDEVADALAPAAASITAAAEPTATLAGGSATAAPEAAPPNVPAPEPASIPALMPAITPAPKSASIPALMPASISVPEPAATPGYVAPDAPAVLLKGSAALRDFTTPAANPQAEVK